MAPGNVSMIPRMPAEAMLQPLNAARPSSTPVIQTGSPMAGAVAGINNGAMSAPEASAPILIPPPPVGPAPVTVPDLAAVVVEAFQGIPRQMADYVRSSTFMRTGPGRAEFSPGLLQKLLKFHWEKENTLEQRAYLKTGQWTMDEMKKSEGIAHALIQAARYIRADDLYKPLVLVLGPGHNMIEVAFWLEMGARVVAVEAEETASMKLATISNPDFTLVKELSEIKADIVVAIHPDTTGMASLQPEDLVRAARAMGRLGTFLIQTDNPRFFSEIFRNPFLNNIFGQPVDASNFFMPSGYRMDSGSIFSVLMKR